MADPYRSLVVKLAQAQLTSHMKEAALVLASLADPDTGRVTFLKEDSQPVLGVQHPGTVRKYLARMAAAGLLDWNGGGKTFTVWFLDWSPVERTYRIPAAPPDKKPARTSAKRFPASAPIAESVSPSSRPVSSGKAAPWR